VIESGVATVTLDAVNTALVAILFEFHIPKQVIVEIKITTGTTTSINKKVFNNAFIKLSFSNNLI
jgi:hypothetical protein